MYALFLKRLKSPFGMLTCEPNQKLDDGLLVSHSSETMDLPVLGNVSPFSSPHSVRLFACPNIVYWFCGLQGQQVNAFWGKNTVDGVGVES